jgi:hypothetical protein
VKALSIRQPWAWLIVNGHKDVENRTWRTAFRGEALIHAGQRLTAAAIHRIRWEFPDVPLPETYELGGIVGRVSIIDCVMVMHSRWFEGPWGLVLRNPAVLPFSPCKGRLGFFDVDSAGVLLEAAR